MAHSAHTDPEAIKEHTETPEDFERKCQELANLIQNSKHVVVSTGAGISTSTGIPDYRGPEGVWTLAAQGKRRENKTTKMEAAVPSPAHMALFALMQAGKLHHVITQNVDGLHRKAGIPPEHLSELHGNSGLEICTKCGKEYFRDYHLPIQQTGKNHLTGGVCTVIGCGGALKDSIINFGESLPAHHLQKGEEESQKADLHLVFGTSLTVSPANDLPATTQRKKSGKLVIVNLQKTHLDKKCAVRVFSTCDDVLKKVLHLLNIGCPPNFTLNRTLALWRQQCGKSNKEYVCVDGLDPVGVPFSLVKKASIVAVNGKPKTEPILSHKEPHQFRCPVTTAISVKVEFFGHYEEPDVVVELPANEQRVMYNVHIDPLRQPDWSIVKLPTADAEKITLPVQELPNPSTSSSSSSNMDEDEEPTAVHKEEDVYDTRQWHSVQPSKCCPHIATAMHMFEDGAKISCKAPCENCNNVGENMICLSCHKVFCGRHVNGHMVEHNQQNPDHCLVCGFIDLSIWCYQCDDYIDPFIDDLFDVFSVLHCARFGEPPPAAARITTKP